MFVHESQKAKANIAGGYLGLLQQVALSSLCSSILPFFIYFYFT
jgi:hypothetical protein